MQLAGLQEFGFPDTESHSSSPKVQVRVDGLEISHNLFHDGRVVGSLNVDHEHNAIVFLGGEEFGNVDKSRHLLVRGLLHGQLVQDAIEISMGDIVGLVEASFRVFVVGDNNHVVLGHLNVHLNGLGAVLDRLVEPMDGVFGVLASVATMARVDRVVASSGNERQTGHCDGEWKQRRRRDEGLGYLQVCRKRNLIYPFLATCPFSHAGSMHDDNGQAVGTCYMRG